MSFLNRAKGSALGYRFSSPIMLAHTPLIWAQAQPQPAPAGESWLTLLIMLGLMMIFFYFFLIRPQRKRQQEHQALIESLRRGDEVVTIGGIYGKIVKIEKDYITLEVNEEGTTMRVLKESITQKEKAA